MAHKQIQFELTSEHLIVHCLNHYQYAIHHKNIIYFIVHSNLTVAYCICIRMKNVT